MHGRKIRQLVLNDETTITSSSEFQLIFWRESYEGCFGDSWVVRLENNIEVGRYGLTDLFYIEWEKGEKE